MTASSPAKTIYWHELENGKIQCDLCPRECKLNEGQRGLCYVRGRENNQIVLHAYGQSSGFCIDPIEKKPLNHFLPGTPVFSFGTAGCNLSCKFCQNWDISKSREIETLSDQATPEKLALEAKLSGSRSIAYTYNDPVIFMEYAKDISLAAKSHGLYTVAVSAGFINPKAREEFFSFIDATNIDLKAFSESFYRKITSGSLAPVLDTLKYIKQETNIWLEITTLLIPGLNDSEKELNEMTQWIYENLGPSVPVHFTAFHPDWKMRDIEHTPVKTLKKAQEIAKQNGLYYVFTGNVQDSAGQSTYCHKCGKLLIERNWYHLGEWRINAKGNCGHCGAKCFGIFEESPGKWGAKRQSIIINEES